MIGGLLRDGICQRRTLSADYLLAPMGREVGAIGGHGID